MVKKFFINLINSKLVLSLSLCVFMILILGFVAYPGLNNSNIVLNVISSIIIIFVLLFIYFYLKRNYIDKEEELVEFSFNDIKESETELDYDPSIIRKGKNSGKKR